MAKFDIEFKKVILAEGGYVNDKDDKGGETYLGISRKNNPNWNGWKQVDTIKNKYGTKNITNILKQDKELTNNAKNYYKEHYWNKLELDDIKSQDIASILFDTCVNCGIKTAVTIAQKICNINVTGKWSKKLKELLMEYE